jgi:hypothetical protein
VSICHPRGEVAGDLETFAALRGRVPDVRAFVQPLVAHLDPRRVPEKLRFFDLCWDRVQGSFGLEAIHALSVGVVPIVGPGASASDELARFFGEAPFLGRDLEGAVSLVQEYARDPSRLRRDQARAREVWETRWRAGPIVERYVSLYREA